MGHAHMHDSSDERRDAAGAGGKTSKSTSSKQRGFRQGLQDFALGATVGGVTKTILAPVERVKLLMQTMDSNENVRSGQVKRYEGIMDCISRVKAEQGVAAFWRGNLVNCLRYAPQQGSALAFNDALNKAFPKYDSDKEFLKSLGVRLVSGGTAGALSATLTYPFDYARTRLASDVKKGKGQFDGIADCIMTTVRSQGLTGLYTGWSVTVAGAFVYRAGQLGCFKQIQDMNPYKDDKGTLGVVSAFCAVTAARTVVMPFNYPFDTVRRRMMLQSEKPKSERLYTGSVDCFTKIFKNEGVTGMYKGMLPEMFRGVGGSLVIVGYDRIKAIFNL